MQKILCVCEREMVSERVSETASVWVRKRLSECVSERGVECVCVRGRALTLDLSNLSKMQTKKFEI